MVVLGIIGAERPEALDEFAARSAAVELLKVLYKGGTGPFTQVPYKRAQWCFFTQTTLRLQWNYWERDSHRGEIM